MSERTRAGKCIACGRKVVWEAWAAGPVCYPDYWAAKLLYESDITKAADIHPALAGQLELIFKKGGYNWPADLDSALESRHFDIDEIVALHNAALDINPSNPMAVAEGLERAIETLRRISVILANPLTTRTEQPVKIRIHRAADEAWLLARDMVAAITKPTDKGGRE